MINQDTLTKLCDLIRSIGYAEKNINIYRELLAEKHDFEPYAAFTRLDRYKLDSITATNLTDFLMENGRTITRAEANRLIAKYAGPYRTRLNFKEFLQLILPHDSYLRFMAVQRPTYSIENYQKLEFPVENALVRLIMTVIEEMNKLEDEKILLNIKADFNPFRLFRAIDKDYENEINEENLMRFMEENGMPISGNLVTLFIRSLDRNMDGKLTFDEFEQGISTSYIQSPKKEYPMTEKKEQAKLYPVEIEPQSEPQFTKGLDTEMEPRPDIMSKPNYEDIQEYASPEQNEQMESGEKPMYKPENEQPIENAEVAKRLEYTESQVIDEKTSKKQITEEELVLAFKDQARIEKMLEGYRTDLALCSDFNIYDGYRIFDPMGNCYATTTDFINGLRDLGINKPTENMKLLFIRYDRDQDSKIKCSDFADMVLPKDKFYQKLVLNRMPMGELGKKFTPKTQMLLKMLLDYSIDHEITAERIRQDLKENPHFDIYSAFMSVDSENSHSLTIETVF